LRYSCNFISVYFILFLFKTFQFFLVYVLD